MAPPLSDKREDVWAAQMRAALTGDEAAYRRLLADFGRAIRPAIRGAFSRSRVGDADVEDVVQETLLAIHLKRRAEPIEDFEQILAAPEEPDPHQRSDVERLMQTLTPRARDIVRSISLDEQSITVTATRLGMSEVAVRVALHRALKSLATAWRGSLA